MMKWIPLNPIDIPQKDGILKVKIGGQYVCVIQYRDQLVVTSARCPHAGADLSQGWCEAGRLICPYHRHAFDLQSGRGDIGQGNYIHVYPVENRDGTWYVGFKKSWLHRLISIKKT